MKDLKRKIRKMLKEEYCPLSDNLQYVYKQLIISEHALKRFGERFNLSEEILMALVILHYNNILKHIKNNLSDLVSSRGVEYQIKYEDNVIVLVIRKDRFNKDKFLIRTVKRNYEGIIEKYKKKSIYVLS